MGLFSRGPPAYCGQTAGRRSDRAVVYRIWLSKAPSEKHTALVCRSERIVCLHLVWRWHVFASSWYLILRPSSATFEACLWRTSLEYDSTQTILRFQIFHIVVVSYKES